MKGSTVFAMVMMTVLTACGAGNAQQAAAAPTGVTVTEQYEYYQIAGNSETELRNQMTTNGIKWDDGKTYDALTTWNVKWDYGYTCGTLGCTAENFNATVAITFRYPSWQPTDVAPGALVQKWDTYMHNLIIHENGHRDMAVRETQGLADAVTQLPPAASRRELDREVAQLANARMAQMNTDERDYDTETIHGTTQGAVFP